MTSKKKNSETIANQIDVREYKTKYGKNEEFLSREHFPFNAFDDLWLLTGLGNQGQRVDFSWLHNSKFSKRDQIDLRYACAGLATKLAASSIINICYVLSTTELSELTIPAFKALWPSIDDIKKSRFRSFVFGLYDYDPKRFKYLNEWILSVNVNKQKRNIYDPEKGHLSDLENQSFNIAMNQYSATLMKKSYGYTDNWVNSGLGNLTSLRTFIATRIMQVLVRRPSNLIQLKWSDIGFDGIFVDKNKTLFSDDDELKIRMFKAKSRGNFRDYPEGDPLLLNNAISKEVLFYQRCFLQLFSKVLIEQKIDLSNDELHTIFMRLPIFYTDTLFKTQFINKTNLFEALSDNGSGFHMDNKTLQVSISWLLNKSLNIVSERIPHHKFRINNNRIRHTLGTSAARDGVHINKIAKLLGNTPHAARIYVDLSDEARLLIDQNFIANDFLANAFSTNITSLLGSGDIAIENNYGEQFGKSNNINACQGCHRSKPIGCYGCVNFHALVTGDHRSQKDKAQKIYDYRVKSGDSPNGLLELKKQICFIDTTMMVCDQMLRQKK